MKQGGRIIIVQGAAPHPFSNKTPDSESSYLDDVIEHLLELCSINLKLKKRLVSVTLPWGEWIPRDHFRIVLAKRTFGAAEIVSNR